MNSKDSSPELDSSFAKFGITEKQFKVGKPLIGSLPFFRPDPIKFLMGLSQFGDVSKTKFGPFDIYLVNHVDGIKHVLHTNNKNYLKSPFLDVVRLVLGEGLLTAEGSKWAKDRRIIHQAFVQGQLVQYGDWVGELCQEAIIRWDKYCEKGESFDVASEMMDLTFSVICKSLFSTVNKEFVKVVEHAMPILLRYVEYANNSVIKWPLFVPTKLNRDFKNSLKSIKAISRKIIKEHQDNPGKYNDLLTKLLNTTDPETGEKIREKDIEDHIITLFLAGHETTAICLTWTWYMLGTHPEVLEKLQEEVDKVIPHEGIAGYEQLSSLKYTYQVIQESMRFYPPAWEFDRIAINDDVVLGTPIPKGSIIMICPYLIHRDPRFWEDPLHIKPERFSEENEKNIVPYSYIPFGAGPRACIGKNFAMMEAVLILANLSRRFKVQVNPFPEPQRETLMTMRPKNGVFVRLQKRSKSSSPVTSS